MRSLIRLSLTVATTTLAVAAIAAPASAHAPKPGTKCAMSGMVFTDEGTSVCQPNAAGKLVWSKALPASKSPLTLKDGWTKAADTGMSAAFGMLVNPTNKPINVIAATSPYAKAIQLHEVVMKDGSMVMQQKPGGFTIPAKGSFELKAGGNHMMFMGITKAIKPGAIVPVTIIASDGSKFTVRLMAKTYTGANETYDSSMSGMS